MIFIDMFKEFFEYKNGELFWKKKTNLQRNVKIGQRAGSDISGYLGVTFFKRKYLVHRIIWEMFYGPIPKGYEIDHKNRIKDDNRIENLRLCTRIENLVNRSKQKNGKRSKYKGVYLHVNKNTGWTKFKSCIGVNKKYIALGYFENERDAALAYNKKAKELYGEFAVLNEVEINGRR